MGRVGGSEERERGEREWEGVERVRREGSDEREQS